MTPTLPPLAYVGHEQQKMTLHLFLQIIGKIRLMLSPRKNHWWYITEYIDTQGLTTGPIPYQNGMKTFTLMLNVHSHQVEVFTSDGEIRSFDLSGGLSVAEFYNNLMKLLRELNIPVKIYDKPFDQGIDKKFSEVTEYHHYNKDYVKTLWQIFLWVDGVFKEFSGRFYGKTCPVHLYWHSMDLTVTRFNGKEAPKMPREARLSDKDAYSHECISFGFWAGDANMQEPAFYSYTFPSPAGIENEKLEPQAAHWIENNGSQMAILTYRELIKFEDPRAALLNFLESAYQAGAKTANWDIEKLTVPELKEL